MGIKDGELHTPLLMLVHETILVIQALLCDELGDAITLLGTGTNVLLSPLSEGGRTSWKKDRVGQSHFNSSTCVESAAAALSRRVHPRTNEQRSCPLAIRLPTGRLIGVRD